MSTISCPECDGTSVTLDSRAAAIGGTKRRRQCENGHRFSTLEVVVEGRARLQPGRGGSSLILPTPPCPDCASMRKALTAFLDSL